MGVVVRCAQCGICGVCDLGAWELGTGGVWLLSKFASVVTFNIIPVRVCKSVWGVAL